MLLWRGVVSHKLLAGVSIILFLNKCDLLRVRCPFKKKVFFFARFSHEFLSLLRFPSLPDEAGGWSAPELPHAVLRVTPERLRVRLKMYVDVVVAVAAHILTQFFAIRLQAQILSAAQRTHT